MADKSMDGLNTFTAQTAESVDTSRKLRVGIIGCGWIAGSHIKAYLNQPDVEYTTVLFKDDVKRLWERIHPSNSPFPADESVEDIWVKLYSRGVWEM